MFKLFIFKMKITNILFLLCLSLGLALSAPTYYDGIRNKNIERSIDLNSQFARHNVKIEVENKGNKATSEYYLTVQQGLAAHLADIKVTDESNKQLTVSKGENVDDKKNSYVAYRIELGKSLAASESTKIQVALTFSHVFTPFPASIAQTEKQLVKYYDNHYFFSPYSTGSQTTIVKLSSPNIESKTEEAPTSVKGDQINYGPYEDVKSFSVSQMTLHFENNKPFLTVTSLTKEIEISHWGNVAVEETYDYISHDGAKLKGTFSRFDYQRSYGRSGNVVASLREVLPHGAADVYYRDEIGNISTSHMFAGEEGVVLDIQPRYPLFGGWKIGFYLGYNLPTKDVLFSDANDGSRYVMKIALSTSINDVAIDELTVRVIFPEGAKNIEFSSPVDIDSSSYSTHFTYLDTAGRPVLILKKKNVVPEHNQEFQVAYSFSQSSLMQEPILLVGAYFLFFLFIMLYTRIPLNIGAPKGYAVYGGRVADLLLRFKDIMDQRTEQYSLLENALANLSKNKNESAYNAEKKKPDSSLNEASKRASQVLNELTEAAPELAKKITDLERKEGRKRTVQQQLHENELARAKKAITNSAYEAAKAELERTYLQLDEEIQLTSSEYTDSL